MRERYACRLGGVGQEEDFREIVFRKRKSGVEKRMKNE